ncbi:MAG: efflux RND transporter periplasmic adaptor subunit [Gemmatimonadaceae bacterium]|nr:efflux RND transporter periplasmic adaptor subunit [Gemmatimonadaceae bacterium]
MERSIVPSWSMRHRIAISLIVVLASASGCTAERGAAENEGRASAVDTAAKMSGLAPAEAEVSVEFSAAQLTHSRVKWNAVVQSSMSGLVEVPGQLVANDDRTARLAAPVQARVIAVHVSPGDRVAGGGRLVTLQSPEASMAQADLGKARAELTSRRAAAVYAKSAKDRAERLLALKAIPRQDYERAIADDELARAGVAQAISELRRSQSNASQLGIDVRAGTMTLRSPIGGVVTTRDVAAGAVVSAGAPLITVTDPSSLWLTVALPEGSASAVRVGAALRFTVPTAPRDTFTARIQSVSASFDPTTRSLPVRGVVSNPGGRLRPEMFARVWVESGTPQLTITIPESAVQRLGNKNVVFVAHPAADGGVRFERREVELSAPAGARLPVARGLKLGELIVTEGAYVVKAEFEKGKMPGMEM